MYQPQWKQPMNDFEINPWMAGRSLLALIMKNLNAVIGYYENGEYWIESNFGEKVSLLDWEEWLSDPSFHNDWQIIYHQIRAINCLAQSNGANGTKSGSAVLDPIYFGL